MFLATTKLLDSELLKGWFSFIGLQNAVILYACTFLAGVIVLWLLSKIFNFEDSSLYNSIKANMIAIAFIFVSIGFGTFAKIVVSPMVPAEAPEADKILFAETFSVLANIFLFFLLALIIMGIYKEGFFKMIIFLIAAFFIGLSAQGAIRYGFYGHYLAKDKVEALEKFVDYNLGTNKRAYQVRLNDLKKLTRFWSKRLKERKNSNSKDNDWNANLHSRIKQQQDKSLSSLYQIDPSLRSNNMSRIARQKMIPDVPSVRLNSGGTASAETPIDSSKIKQVNGNPGLRGSWDKRSDCSKLKMSKYDQERLKKMRARK